MLADIEIALHGNPFRLFDLDSKNLIGQVFRLAENKYNLLGFYFIPVDSRLDKVCYVIYIFNP